MRPRNIILITPEGIELMLNRVLNGLWNYKVKCLIITINWVSRIAVYSNCVSPWTFTVHACFSCQSLNIWYTQRLSETFVSQYGLVYLYPHLYSLKNATSLPQTSPKLQWFVIVLKLNRCIAIAAETLVKYQSDTGILIPNLPALQLHEYHETSFSFMW